MSEDQRSRSFDHIAELYEAARPGYPEALVERVVQLARLGATSRLLEIGCGTGKATRAFAARGYELLALEPGTELAELARASVAEQPKTRVDVVAFEDWQGSDGSFDLAFVAQAFHWLDPAQRLPRIARALRPGGALAVFGNCGHIESAALRAAIEDVYHRLSPSLAERNHAYDWYASADSPISVELRAAADFGEPQHELFRWRQRYTASGYSDLLSTYSDHSTLPAARLRAILGEIAEAVHARGGSVDIEYRTGLFFARTVLA